MKTTRSLDPGKASIGEDCAMPRKSRRAKLSLRSSEKKTLLGFRPDDVSAWRTGKRSALSNFVLNRASIGQ